MTRTSSPKFFRVDVDDLIHSVDCTRQNSGFVMVRPACRGNESVRDSLEVPICPKQPSKGCLELHSGPMELPRNGIHPVVRCTHHYVYTRAHAAYVGYTTASQNYGTLFPPSTESKTPVPSWRTIWVRRAQPPQSLEYLHLVDDYPLIRESSSILRSSISSTIPLPSRQTRMHSRRRPQCSWRVSPTGTSCTVHRNRPTKVDKIPPAISARCPSFVGSRPGSRSHLSKNLTHKKDAYKFGDQLQ